MPALETRGKYRKCIKSREAKHQFCVELYPRTESITRAPFHHTEATWERSIHCKEYPSYVFLFWELSGLSPNFHIHVYVSDLYVPGICPHMYFPAEEYADRSWKYINLSKIYECRNWETEHYNSVLEITVSFLGIHKWEPDIYIGFSPVLHLQCRQRSLFLLQ